MTQPLVRTEQLAMLTIDKIARFIAGLDLIFLAGELGYTQLLTGIAADSKHSNGKGTILTGGNFQGRNALTFNPKSETGRADLP